MRWYVLNYHGTGTNHGTFTNSHSRQDRGIGPDRTIRFKYRRVRIIRRTGHWIFVITQGHVRANEHKGPDLSSLRDKGPVLDTGPVPDLSSGPDPTPGPDHDLMAYDDILTDRRVLPDRAVLPKLGRRGEGYVPVEGRGINEG
jgi:hypothetical protein